MQHIFISLKHEDLDFGENVIARLEKEGFTTWTDLKIGPGEEWRTTIDLAIKGAFALIVIMTPEAKASEYVTYEWAFAWGVGIRVIPIMLRPTALHPRLEALQYLDFTNIKSRPWERLLEEVRAAANAPLAHSVNIPINSPPFIRQAVSSLDSSNHDDRQGAILTLQTAATPAAITVLREALKHPLPDVRQWAASALAELKDSRSIPALIDAIKDRSLQYRESFIMALGYIGSPSVVSDLLEILKRDEQNLWASTAQALGHIGDKSAVPALIDKLEYADSNTSVAAIQALGELGDLAAVPVIIEALEDTADSRLSLKRQYAADALRKLADPSAVPALIVALMDADNEVCWNAVKALGAIGDPAAGPALIEALKIGDNFDRREDHRIVYEAMRIVGRFGDPVAAPVLIARLKDSENEQIVAVDALGDLGDPTIVPAMIEHLDLPDNFLFMQSNLQFAIVRAWGNLGNPAAVPILERVLKMSANHQLRAFIERSIEYIGERNDAFPSDA
jgi:HEAT repeat protein